MWTHAISDLVIAISYFSIPFAIIFFLKKRDDISFQKVFLLFAAFIVTCGVGHLVDLWNIWNSDYHWSALIRGITATISLATAVGIWVLMPDALTIPSRLSLEEEVRQKEEAQSKIDEVNQSLELRIAERTHELERFNGLAVDREQRMIQLKARINELCLELDYPPEYDLTFMEKE